MSSVSALKNKLVLVARSGTYVNFAPSQVQKYHHETERFLMNSSDELDAVELFDVYEMQFHLALITSHDVEAKAILDRLVDQFGSSENSQRIRLLQSKYLEVMGEPEQALKVLGNDPDELRLSRRLTTNSRKSGNAEEYIANLNFYLDLQPSDLITWAELGDEYAKVGHYDKAVFSLQEILLQEPFAYPVFYKVGLYNYYRFLQEEQALKTERKDKLWELVEILQDARNNYLRSVEICDVYIKSWIGIYLISSHKFNDKLRKLNSVKEVAKFLEQNDKLKTLSEKKIRELDQEAWAQIKQ
ncbi:uncharacterized protein CANTADRAFT_52938 [Suhomyces tanzawaensis NRRL Y-17324]|uniref:ER membrane protein complex subunit 2 n=1 Tax=Suhomyces tanzawaensis NRRL Y-17324 TaxID=984487 RepID=A0A1E4SGP4_9ASCO|nr:uncharacterized protein CANTADRAFT_52938 [Suhomyces tanzawaensis NRRL Y-17324]ODV78683.1 hypothetical protein CANTADRAFT_52938 [Suhomyces tanzawaensis NRRL Y-17324]